MKILYDEQGFKVRFWSRVATSDFDSCWNWLGRRSQYGYGQVKYHSDSFQAHRMAYKLVNGAIPNKINVLHTCDNRACVNPKHLYLGTQIDNMRDCRIHGRFPNRRDEFSH